MERWWVATSVSVNMPTQIHIHSLTCLISALHRVTSHKPAVMCESRRLEGSEVVAVLQDAFSQSHVRRPTEHVYMESNSIKLCSTGCSSKRTRELADL